MQSFTSKCAVALASLVISASALNGIVAPGNITADKKFEVTFENGNDDEYRVYLAAALAGVNGPACEHLSRSRHSCRSNPRQATSSTQQLSRARSATSRSQPVSDLQQTTTLSPLRISRPAKAQPTATASTSAAQLGTTPTTRMT